jgi:F1F0 ATPase subunit 2
MNDFFTLGAAFLGGVLLGVFFFGGLWWTICKGMNASNPAIWFLFSFLARTVVTVAGIYLVAKDHWPKFIGCFLGFMVARSIVKRILRIPVQPRAQPYVGAKNAT